jgi:AMMECR1 domain-containing protein
MSVCRPPKHCPLCGVNVRKNRHHRMLFSSAHAAVSHVIRRAAARQYAGKGIGLNPRKRRSFDRRVSAFLRAQRYQQACRGGCAGWHHRMPEGTSV